MSAGSILPSEGLHESPSLAKRTGSRFYAWVALAAALIIFAGFARTFYLRSM
jgi:hypothetical protein